MFSFSFIELFAWILSVPIISGLATSMVLLAFIVLRVIISIVGYEVYYKKNMGELSKKLLEEESEKEIEKKKEKSQ
jgi:Tfp pilus assembly protein PilO